MLPFLFPTFRPDWTVALPRTCVYPRAGAAGGQVRCLGVADGPHRAKRSGDLERKQSRRTIDGMPTTDSARKHLRSDLKRRMRNQMRKSRIKTGRKQLLDKVAQRDLAGAEEVLRKVFSELDRAAKAGTIHKNTASRGKRRLAATVAALRTGAEETAAQ